MIDLHPRYLVNEQGERVAVVLDVAEFEELLAEAGQDPDAGLILRDDVRRELEQQAREFDSGQVKEESLADVRRELGLD